MPREKITRRKKNISRLLREKKQIHKDKLKAMRFLLLLIPILLVANLSFAKPETTYPADYYNELGIKAGETKDYDNAIKYFQKAIQTDPQYISAYINLSRIYGTTGEYEKAITTLNKAVELKLRQQEIYINLGEIYEKMGNYDKAIECAQDALSLGRKNPIANYNLGYAYLKNKDRTGAIRQCDILREIGEATLADRLQEEISRRWVNE